MEIKDACFLIEKTKALLIVLIGDTGSGRFEVLCGFEVAQAREGDSAPLGARLGRVQGEAIERRGLDVLDGRQKIVSLRQLTGLDGLLNIGFQGCDLWIVARLGCRSRLQGLEAIGDVDELRGELLGRDVGFAQDV